MKERIILLLMFLLPVQGVMAGEENFATTSEGIVQQLSALQPAAAAPKVRLRSFPGSNTSSESAAVALRSVKRVQKNSQGQVIEEVVQVPVEQTAAHVNLKIEFDQNSYAVRPESYTLLKELGKALEDDTLNGKAFYINGHTDADGSDSLNLRLSLNRAQSVKQFLGANYRVPEDRLTVVGYGESMPIAANNSSYGKQLNRRVEVVVK